MNVYQRDFLKPKDRSFSAEDTSFVTGDSPATHNIHAIIGINTHDGYLINDGPGDLYMTWTSDGTNYWQNARIKKNETYPFNNMSIHSIRVIWISNTSYRINAI